MGCDIADIAGLAVAATRSRMTVNRHRRPVFAFQGLRCRSLLLDLDQLLTPELCCCSKLHQLSHFAGVIRDWRNGDEAWMSATAVAALLIVCILVNQAAYAQNS